MSSGWEEFFLQEGQFGSMHKHFIFRIEMSSDRDIVNWYLGSTIPVRV